MGSDLLIAVGKPEVVLPAMLGEGSVVVTQEEVTSEELSTDKSMKKALQANNSQLEYCWGSTLFHRDDMPFQKDFSDAPDVFTVFKNKVEPELSAAVNEVPSTFQGQKKAQSSMGVRPCLPDLEPGSLPLSLPGLSSQLEFEPSWEDLPYEEPVAPPEQHAGAAMKFEGGEDAALARLKYYLFDTHLIASYFDVRNGMLGPDYSTKLAPWLALGCVSPRKVFEQVRQFEKTQVANKSTYWVLFELTWRDFFRIFAAKHGDAIFRPHGVTGKPRQWNVDENLFQLWAQGRTGYPLVDANMRELQATGFMSNRGRQNVASFLALDMGVDWRRGADLFESLLLDYDVASNWGNWVSAAGLTTGRINRFNVVRQSKAYDSDGTYLRHWLPELGNVPTKFVHEPWKMSEEDRAQYGADTYPSPCLDPMKFPTEYREPKKKGKPWTKKDAFASGGVMKPKDVSQRAAA